jgi:hypothetical protein
MLKQVEDALVKGVYPGWEEDLLSQRSKRPEPSEKTTVRPKPIFAGEEKGIVKSRAGKAAQRIGRHLMATFFDDMEGVDFHQLVMCTWSHILCYNVCASRVHVCAAHIIAQNAAEHTC